MVQPPSTRTRFVEKRHGMPRVASAAGGIAPTRRAGPVGGSSCPTAAFRWATVVLQISDYSYQAHRATAARPGEFWCDEGSPAPRASLAGSQRQGPRWSAGAKRRFTLRAGRARSIKNPVTVKRPQRPEPSTPTGQPPPQRSIEHPPDAFPVRERDRYRVRNPHPRDGTSFCSSISNRSP